SLRFEKGIGPDMAEYAMRRALHLFEQITGGTVASGLIDVYPGKSHPPTITLPVSRVEQVLGLAVPDDDVRRILTALGFSFEAAYDAYVVRPPYWRPDVTLPEDLVEEIGRIYGYDRL